MLGMKVWVIEMISLSCSQLITKAFSPNRKSRVLSGSSLPSIRRFHSIFAIG